MNAKKSPLAGHSLVLDVTFGRIDKQIKIKGNNCKIRTIFSHKFCYSSISWEEAVQ
jgi:hypothetical protein